MDRTVEGYLAELRQDLTGADPAVVQDALYDAEEYLRSAIAEQGDAPDAFDVVVEAYGAPAEVAAAYLETEVTVARALKPHEPTQHTKRNPFVGFFAIVADPNMWGSLFYMLLAFVTGIVYFTVVVTGLSLSLGLLITLLGIPIALLLIAIVRAVSLAEGRIVEGLLGVRMPRRPRMVGAQGSIWTRLSSWFTDLHTWTTMLYMLLQLALGTTYFVLLVTGFSVCISLIAFPFAQAMAAQPILEIEGTMYVMEPWAYPLSVAIGVLGVFVMFWIARGIGRLHGAYAKVMLVGRVVDQPAVQQAAPQQPPSAPAASAGVEGDGLGG